METDTFPDYIKDRSRSRLVGYVSVKELTTGDKVCADLLFNVLFIVMLYCQ